MSADPGAEAPLEEQPIAVIDGESYPDRPHASHRFVGPDLPMLDAWPYEDDPAASAAAQAAYLV